MKGLMAGVCGGLLASFFMEQFQSVWQKISKELNAQQEENESQGEPATVKAAQAISTGLTHQKIRKETKLRPGK